MKENLRIKLFAGNIVLIYIAILNSNNYILLSVSESDDKILPSPAVDAYQPEGDGSDGSEKTDVDVDEV